MKTGRTAPVPVPPGKKFGLMRVSIWSVARFVFGRLQGAAAGALSSIIFLPGLAWVLWRLRDAPAVRLWHAATLALLPTCKFFSPQ